MMPTSEKNNSRINHSDLRGMAYFSPRDAEEVFKNSATFAQALRAHIVEEESSESWFVEIREKEPRLISVMNDLTDQHRELEKITEEILLACQSGNLPLVSKAMELCVSLFETHEQTEDIIMQEYFYRDLGEP